MKKDLVINSNIIMYATEYKFVHKEYDKYMRKRLTQAEKDYLEIMGEDIKKLK